MPKSTSRAGLRPGIFIVPSKNDVTYSPLPPFWGLFIIFTKLKIP